jgi:hypothetical protein
LIPICQLIVPWCGIRAGLAFLRFGQKLPLGDLITTKTLTA